jgi:hypothetical protein
MYVHRNDAKTLKGVDVVVVVVSAAVAVVAVVVASASATIIVVVAAATIMLVCIIVVLPAAVAVIAVIAVVAAVVAVVAAAAATIIIVVVVYDGFSLPCVAATKKCLKPFFAFVSNFVPLRFFHSPPFLNNSFPCMNQHSLIFQLPRSRPHNRLENSA